MSTEHGAAEGPAHRVHSRSELGDLVAAMAHWPDADAPVTGLHPGDLGWHLRLADDAVEGAFHGWWYGDDLLAVALLEGPVGRYAVAPGRREDPALARLLAASCAALPGDEVYADVPRDTALAATLAAAGWTPDPDPWVALFARFDTWTPPVDTSRARIVTAEQSVEDRVAVQRAGFEGSTFTVGAWQRMAAGPGYRPDLDLVVYADDGRPAAIATAWSVGPGATAILEPVATHGDLRAQGWGLLAVTAVVERMRALGASGVSVSTPQANAGAVALYRSAGLLPATELRSFVRQRAG